MADVLPCDMDYLRLRATECGDCLEWRMACVGGRYPVTTFRLASDGGRQRQFYVRHLVYELKHGKPPPKDRRLCISTSCENDRCIAPNHVVVTTKKALTDRAAARGLFSTVVFRAKVSQSRQKTRKLSDEDVRDIRASDAPVKDLAAKHGVSNSYVRLVRRGSEAIDYSSPFAPSRLGVAL